MTGVQTCALPIWWHLPRSQGCHVRGSGRSTGAESPPQVAPGHDWHILRSQEMLCTAPPVIKHCCSPAAPQCVPHRPLTLQSSHTFHSPMFTLVHTAPHAPSLETPYLPSITHLYHIPCTHHSTTFATHPHYIFTSHPTTSPNHVHTPTPSSHLVSQHVHSFILNSILDAIKYFQIISKEGTTRLRKHK